MQEAMRIDGQRLSTLPTLAPGTVYVGCDLSGASLATARFDRCKLTGCDLATAHLLATEFVDCDMRRPTCARPISPTRPSLSLRC